VKRLSGGDADMTDSVKEQLSACLDGQLPEGELDLMLKRLQRDAELRRTMDGYSLIGEVMRGQRTVRASAGFADRVAAAVASEPATKDFASRPSREKVLTWLRPAAGLAIAASVAAIAVMSFRPASDGTQPLAQIVADSSQADDDAAASYTVPTHVDTTSGAGYVPAARLTNYVVAHSEYSSPLGRRTVLSGVLSDDQEPGIDADSDDADADVQISGTPSSASEESPR
jgi:sigma-E factor negative regulatory protein RseA